MRTAVSEPQSELSPGQVLDRRFEIVGLLGHGGLGTVYRAVDRLGGSRVVALKVLLPRYRARPERRARLHREAELCRRVGDVAGVVRCVEVGASSDLGGCPFLVFEVAPGRELNAVIAHEGRFEPEVAARVARALAVAIRSVHRAGVVHRDVTVRNVFLARDGERLRVTLIDFSHAAIAAPQHFGRFTLPGDVPGTPRYMGPEQARGEPAAPAMDVFSWGVVLFELLAGRNPYAAEGPAEFARRQAEHALRSPRLDARVFSAVPSELVDLLHASLALRAAQRPSIDDVVRRLDAVLRSMAAGQAPGSSAPKCSVGPQRPPWWGRWRIVGPGVGVVAALGLAVGVSWGQRLREAGPAQAGLGVVSDGMRLGPRSLQPPRPVAGESSPVESRATARVDGNSPPRPSPERGTVAPDGIAEEGLASTSPLGDACGRVRAAGVAAARRRAWRRVLMLTERRACWPRAEARRALRVSAYQALGKHERCVAAARGTSNLKTQRIAADCRNRGRTRRGR